MLKTIKTTKKMRLDELIKYVIENDLKSIQYTSEKSKDVYISSEGEFLICGNYAFERLIYLNDTFIIEVEEKITSDTVFDTLVNVNDNDEVYVAWNDSIDLYDKEQTKEIHAVINGKLELIWERDSND